jgi:serine/threonine-protein kinase
MGVVYRARQRRPDRAVALKVLAPEVAADSGFRERFERESQTAASIEHPNVIPVYDVGEEAGLLYIAMRFVDGMDFRERIGLSPSSDEVVSVVQQTADALDAAHASGLVHRDVKPGNVLITTPGGRVHAYLTDFGLTKHTAASQGLTSTGAFVGTIDYVAPEQIEGVGRSTPARMSTRSHACSTTPSPAARPIPAIRAWRRCGRISTSRRPRSRISWTLRPRAPSGR